MGSSCKGAVPIFGIYKGDPNPNSEDYPHGKFAIRLGVVKILKHLCRERRGLAAQNDVVGYIGLKGDSMAKHSESYIGCSPHWFALWGLWAQGLLSELGFRKERQRLGIKVKSIETHLSPFRV